MKKQNVLLVDSQEFSTILAALRFYQEKSQGDPAYRSDMIHEIATENIWETSMDAEGIDKLCQRINTEDIDPIVKMLKALRSYEWNNDYRKFCKDLNLREDSYAEDRWIALGKMVQQFSLLDFKFPAQLIDITLNK